ncbi:MAG: putative toxin-antitoxin system toxin component, PIN family [Steroidobacteraceae bacterium]|nr:putative toxin-antitoxin system toxin component, PIN family [Steroidobacteraceae bacterium]
MRVVIDTNLWLSGLMLPASVPGHIVRAAAGATITAVLSEPLWEELRLALAYPKVRRRIRLTDDELARYLAELRYMTEPVDIAGVRVRVPRDRGDDVVLATLLASRADYLLTGDRDLLDLADRHPIVTARQFHDEYLR